MQLFGDLIRLAVHHWHCGISSCLLVPPTATAVCAPILRVPCLHTDVSQSYVAIRNWNTAG